jgi:hypothetical protein
VTGEVRADNVTVNLTATSPDYYTVHVNGQTVSGYTGPYTWSKVSGSNALPSTFTTFCVELLQNTNNPTTYTLTSLSNVPQPGTGVPGGPGMGTTRANLISGLWGTFYSQTLGNYDNAAAFQLAIWEFVYGSSADGWNLTDTSANYYVTSGTHSDGTSHLAATDPVVQEAQSWVNFIVAGVNVKMENDLIGLTNSTYQDQVATVPAPPSLLLAGFGGLGLLVGRWRRRTAM